MKKCSKCGTEKDEGEFSKGWVYNGVQHLNSYCRECAKKYRESYKEKWPWKLTYRWVHTRCNLPNHDSYKGYGSIGIRNLLTIEDLKNLWIRDGASSMKKPSIDRVDPKKDYSLDNCRYIELSLNSAKKQTHS